MTAAALACEAGFGESLIFDRSRILAGEWWRVLTGQFSHFGGSHLAWNLAVFIPAGTWCERVAPAATCWFLLIAPGLIGVGLFFGEPRLEHYAGLSGVAAGLLVLLAAEQLAAPSPRDRWFWWAVLALVLAKIAAESLARAPMLVQFSQPEMRPVPLAHALGLVLALVTFLLGRGLAGPRRRRDSA